MVFQSTSRRRAPQKWPDGSNGVLPNELLVQIADELPNSDILNFRLASSSFAGTGAAVLKSRLKCLYIHPAPSSLRAAVEICHSELSSGIEEVRLLGKVLWQDIERRHLRFRHAESSSPELAQDRYAGFRAWPRSFPRAKGPHADDPKPHATFEEAYGTLVDSLNVLPKLSRLAFAERVEMLGWNQVSKSVIETHSKKNAVPRNVGTRRALKAVDEPFPKLAYWADSEIAFGLLFSPSLLVTELCLTAELPFVGFLLEALVPQQEDVPVKMAYKHALGRLTRLELHLSCGWKDTRWHTVCRALLQHAPKIQSLQVVYKYNAAVTGPEVLTSLAEILPSQQTWAELAKFHLVAEVPEGIKKRVHRPVTLRFDLPGFLTRHQARLTSLSISNVLFAAESPGPDIISTFRAVLATMQARDNRVDDFSWEINRFEYHPRCKEPARDHLGSCKFQCSLYCPLNVGLIMTHVLDQLAEEMDVNLMKGQMWDFAKRTPRRDCTEADDVS